MDPLHIGYHSIQYLIISIGSITSPFKRWVNLAQIEKRMKHTVKPTKIIAYIWWYTSLFPKWRRVFVSIFLSNTGPENYGMFRCSYYQEKTEYMLIYITYI